MKHDFLPVAKVPDVAGPHTAAAVPADSPWRRSYVSVPQKFCVALAVSLAWLAFSIWVAIPWARDLAKLSDWAVALFAVGGIAILPGFMNTFLVASLLMDRRPVRRPLETYPGLTILVAAYNDGASLPDTLQSIERQGYPGPFEVMVIDDGSTDATARVVRALRLPWVRLIRQPENAGKSAALNRGLAAARYGLVVTIDADSYLYGDALRNLVERYEADPDDTRAVAGAILVRNSRRNWITRVQEWDYFLGIAATKRVQSMYQGTLVAQGAFSIYDRQLLVDMGGWAECIGEDIVLSWGILATGARIGHAEDAVCFTNAPDSLRSFLQQRRRWARGMMEAFRRHGRILLKPRMSTMFIWWNVFFPWLDLAYLLCFLPGVVLAFFGIYWIVGLMTLTLLPLLLAMNLVMHRIGVGMFRSLGLHVRQNAAGFVLYSLAYGVILQPASVAGYLSELLALRKSWGTK